VELQFRPFFEETLTRPYLISLFYFLVKLLLFLDRRLKINNVTNFSYFLSINLCYTRYNLKQVEIFDNSLNSHGFKYYFGQN